MPGQWKIMTYFAFTLPDKPGQLAQFAADLRGAGINLLGLWGYAPRGDEPRLSCVAESADTFRDFARKNDIVLEEGQTLYLADSDTPGALVDTLKSIADAGINIDAVEAVSGGGKFGCFLWTDESQFPKMQKLLT